MARNPFPQIRNEGGFPTDPAASADAGVVTGPLPGMMTMQFGDEADLLPPPAAERLRELRQLGDDAHLLVRSAHEETQDLRTEIQGHRNRLHRLRGARGADGFDLDDDDVRVTSEQARLDQKMVELKRRSELGELRGERWRILRTTIKNAEDWVRSKPGGTEIVMHEPVEPQLKKGEDILAAIERIRRRGRELEADLARIAASPWPSAIAKQKMRERIGQLAESGRPWVEQAIENDAEIPFQTQTHPVRILNGDPSLIGFTELPDTLALLAWLHGDALIAALDREIDEVADDPNALTAAQRQKAEGEVRADLLSVQRQEAELVWKAQADGAAVTHRPDIDPRALLGVKLIAAPHPNQW
ncbi:hypothetical protein [Bradyrhizobium sp. URHD0069]|uniref:hypothetical protein n=1 Tax=Bradyrhizobium sp. URHD0069 TaxID=1380355 RepID=UPI00049592F2|nr:hypothetical protein [Bradyrhizobium sp. URHD0069]